jgi:hypothetical protein
LSCPIRSSSAEFQVALQESFHCLLVAQLHITLPYAKDCISVWKRTKYVRGSIPGTDTSDTGCCSAQRNEAEAESESDIDDDSEDEEGDLEEDDGQDSDINVAGGEGSNSMRSSDAVTYMSIADLNRLRAGTGTKAEAAVGTKSSQPVSRIKVQGPKSSGVSSEAEVGTDRTDHVTYMSAAELRALRESSSEKEEEEEEEGNEEEDEEVGDRHVGGSKRDRGVRHAGYSYADEEEERGVGRSRGSKRSRRQSDTSHFNGDEDGEREGEGEDALSAVRRLREEALDAQYEESVDKLWACIPKGAALAFFPSYVPLCVFLFISCSHCLLILSSCVSSSYADEVLPVDRAAPCLKHLLDFHPLGGRQVVTY